MTEGFSRRRVLAVAALALIVRAVFLGQWLGLPYVGSLSADAWVHDKWALEILGGQLVRHAAFYQSPFYPYFLAFFYKIFGHHPAGVLWLQVLVDSLSCALILRLGERCFGARAGLLAGLACALYRPFIFSTGLLTKETFVIFSTALFALLALRAGERGLKKDYLFCGLAAGLCALMRTNVLALVPAALFWFWLRRRGRAEPARKFLAAAALPLLLGAALPILPAAVHNFAASRDLVLVNSTGGFTFFIGNNPEATGTAIFPLGISSDPLLEESQSTGLAGKLAGRPLKPSEASAFWFRKGLAFIVEHPARWLGLTAVKFWLFWNWYEIPDNYDLQFVVKHFRTVLGWPLVPFALIGCLGAAGLFLCRWREASGLPALLLAAYLGPLLFFIMGDRYRLPALVFLLPAAGAAADRLLTAAAGFDFKGVWKPCLAALPLMLLCLSRTPFNLELAEAAGWAQLTTVYAERGEHERALEAFTRAFDTDPGGIDDSTVAKAAASLERLGQADVALGLYQRWLKVYPGSPMLHNNCGILLFKLGRTRDGVEMFERALALDPAPAEEYRNLFYGYSKLGKKAPAVKYGEIAAALQPRDAELRRAVAELKNR